MSKVVETTTRRIGLADALVYPDELEAELQHTLATLADVDQAYEQRRVMLERRSISQGQKKRLRAEVDMLHRKDREPLVLRLADLHYRKMRATLFRTVH
jgi:hypothetical protein